MKEKTKCLLCNKLIYCIKFYSKIIQNIFTYQYFYIKNINQFDDSILYFHILVL